MSIYWFSDKWKTFYYWKMIVSPKFLKFTILSVHVDQRLSRSSDHCQYTRLFENLRNSEIGKKPSITFSNSQFFVNVTRQIGNFKKALFSWAWRWAQFVKKFTKCTSLKTRGSNLSWSQRFVVSSSSDLFLKINLSNWMPEPLWPLKSLQVCHATIKCSWLELPCVITMGWNHIRDMIK